MAQVKTSAVPLRLTQYGDDDLMVTLYTRHEGRVSVAAKSARKSRKRFGTSLDLFTELSVMYGQTRNRKGLPVLSESAAERQFPVIRQDVTLAAYAGSWTELLLHATAEGEKSEEIYRLYVSALTLLDSRAYREDILHAWFCIRFLTLSGVGPSISECVQCRKRLPEDARGKVAFRFASGGILCKDCAAGHQDPHYVDLSAIHLLFLLQQRPAFPGELPEEVAGHGAEAGALLYGFVSHHMGLRLKSLEFLRKLANIPQREEGLCRNG
ncbi:MAG: DNA repair protein RecO [Thermodesulfobacteriota bacterium]